MSRTVQILNMNKLIRNTVIRRSEAFNLQYISTKDSLLEAPPGKNAHVVDTVNWSFKPRTEHEMPIKINTFSD
jgi:hypothetical protein